jgi:hypothetical protein
MILRSNPSRWFLLSSDRFDPSDVALFFPSMCTVGVLSQFSGLNFADASERAQSRLPILKVLSRSRYDAI